MNKKTLVRNALILLTCTVGWALLVFYVCAWYAGLDSKVNENALLSLKKALDSSTFSIIVFLLFFWFLYWLNFIPTDKFYKFVDLPDNKEPLTFPKLSAYLGEQAFGSLSATILITYGKSLYESYGVVVVGLYSASISIGMLSFCAISLMRFVYIFTDRKVHHYLLVSVVSMLFMGAMIFIGLKIGEASI
ncbi:MULTISPECIES: hypothetical protein [Vibrio]|uniref:hypothetical protein n=1 Tax=Vibrio TaxID=662 RepID=UPI0003680FF6|nr:MULTISPECIES: hypothetical protein [Vibrio]MDE1233266.1 hypothetical protein [Vibrio aestuarianus]